MRQEPLSPDNIFMIHPEHVVFLSEEIPREYRLQNHITREDALKLWLLMMTLFLPLGVILLAIYYLFFVVVINQPQGLVYATGIAAATIMAVSAWFALRQVQAERRLERRGLPVRGVIRDSEMSRTLSFRGYKPILKLTYDFDLPQGYKVTGQQLIPTRELPEPPDPDTPIAVLYYNDKLHRVL